MAVTMSWAPRTLRRWPRWLRNSAGLFLAPGQSSRSSSQSVRAAAELGVDRDVADALAFAEDP